METGRRFILIGVTIVMVILALAGTIVYLTIDKNDDNSSPSGSQNSSEEALDPPNPIELPPPSSSEMRQFEHAAVSCDAVPCATIGKEILAKGGNAADAAIASLLCMGVVHPASSGTGGGFLMIIYNATTGQSRSLNAREVAPLAATVEMFEGNSSLSQKGGLAVAVPGEVKGLWELYKEMGSGVVDWPDLLAPTIKLCEDGFEIDEFTNGALQEKRESILAEPSLAEIFVNPATADLWQLGETMRRPVLAQSLKIIGQLGGDALYNPGVHNLSTWLVEDLQEFGGIIEIEDLLAYEVHWSESIKTKIRGGFTLHTIPPPGSGALSSFILRILSDLDLVSPSVGDQEAVRTYHLITEAFKHAYAQRTKFGDPMDPDVTEIVNELVQNLTTSESYLESVKKLIKEDSTNNTVEYYGAQLFMPEDHGTAHLSVVAPNGDSIAVTTTVNLFFGAGIRSRRTGIIYNDMMDDFSAPNITNYFGVPPSPNNFIRPGKRPLSSMTPSIYTDEEGRVRLAVGTAGGTKITTATTYVAIRNLWFNETIKEAIDSRRIHHQLYPMTLNYELGFLDQWVKGLEALGHETERTSLGSTCGVARSENGSLFATWDFRKVGSIDGF